MRKFHIESKVRGEKLKKKILIESSQERHSNTYADTHLSEKKEFATIVFNTAWGKSISD